MTTAKEDLERLRDELPEGPARELVEQVLADPHEAAQGLLRVAVILGSPEEWRRPANFLETFAVEVAVAHLPNPGQAASLTLYRQLADALGYDYKSNGLRPGEDDEEEDDET